MALNRLFGGGLPAFTEERARVDVVIAVRDGIEMVTANGNGFSAFDHLTEVMKKPGKKIWRIKRGSSLPHGLVLVEDKRPGHKGHFMIAPHQSMPLKKYLGLDRSRVELVKPGAISNVG